MSLNKFSTLWPIISPSELIKQERPRIAITAIGLQKAAIKVMADVTKAGGADVISGDEREKAAETTSEILKELSYRN